MDPFLGQVKLFATAKGTPDGWLPCDGRLLNISQNQALFALLGICYGGDGIKTFGLPDLRGRVQTNTPNAIPGATGGTATTTIPATALPQHSHAITGFSATADSSSPLGNHLGTALSPIYGTSGTAAPLAAASLSITGANAPISLVQPYQALFYGIAIQGIFPSRP